MKLGTTIRTAIALGLLAVAPACKSPNEHIRTTYHAAVVGTFQTSQSLAVFDVTLEPDDPPKLKTGMDIEVRSGPTIQPQHTVRKAYNQSLSIQWRDPLIPDDAYSGETTYYVELSVYYVPTLPGVPPDVLTFKFNDFRDGDPVPGVLIKPE
jgi:hypothetical protein